MAKKTVAYKIFDSDSIPRITPSLIIRAYKELDLRVNRENYFKTVGNKKYACGLAAYYTHLVIKGTNISLESFWKSYQDAPISKELEEAFGYSSDYLAGFVRGFDGGNLPDLCHQEFKLGFSDGKDSYNKVKSL